MSDRTRSRITRERETGAARRSQPGSYDTAWENGKSWVKGPGYASMDEAPRAVVERALRDKLPWVQRFVNEGMPRGKLLEYARIHAEASGSSPEEIPAYTTLNTWAHQLADWGILGLLDKVRDDAQDPRSVSPEANRLIRVARVGGKMTPGAIVRFLAEHQADDDEIPTYHTVRRVTRRLERENPHLMAAVDGGRITLKNKFRLALAGSDFPAGYRYAMDSTVVDLWVRIPDPKDPSGWTPMRPVLTIVIDAGSRLVLTFWLSLYSIDSGIMLGVFRRVVRQDENFPGLISPGFPHEVLVDKGAEYRKHFASTMNDLGIRMVFAGGAENDPQGNARAERILGSITSEVFASLPGYSPTQKVFDPYAPAKDDVKRSLRSLQYDPYRLELPVGLLPTVVELEAKILAWATVYNTRPHSGLPAHSPELQRLIAVADKLEGN